MNKAKPYLTFSHPYPGPTSFLFKKAAEKNAELLRTRTIQEHREALERLADVRMIIPGTRARPTECAGIPCEWISLADSPEDKVVLYLHGGSWVYGNLHTAQAVGRMLCANSGYRVLVVEYRLAPEHPYPAGPDDCSAVYRWLGENGFPAENIAIFGDSAGGNLTLSLLHRLVAEGRPLPQAVGLASPASDLTDRGMLLKGAPDLLFTQYQGEERHVLDLYCGGADRASPLLSPYYGNLAPFPPMLIHVGQDEDLCLDCDLLAQKAFEAGVDVSLKIWRGMYHDFTTVGATLKESRKSLAELGAFFKMHLQ